ncbi:thermonuclease family protein [Methylomonas sp. EFPC3]|uniref:thermonuclease family protein n=1 Tax=Methylomonas sp. EFPC3 TaxID=3021710 RepID=UPI002415BAAC|nr:thermonuclease family protein [Methylomonas sp. EFPC3]WFP52045.1 thermonuclease family protein [Methylomonas sp. EFPC3]
MLALLVPVIAGAEVYRWTDVHGRSHFSDRHHEDAQVMHIDPGISYYRVEKVFDGDTILLDDGRKVRLLGINTPEIAGRIKSAEAGGEQAKQWLRLKLEQRKVFLQGDVEKQDKYQRTLAYVFNENKQLINVELVKRGLATVNIHPPNLRYVNELLAAQEEAERGNIGVWSDAAYSPTPVERLDQSNYQGWKRVTGKIISLKQTVKHSYLLFSDKVSVSIEPSSLPLFTALESYIGKNVEVRGWVKRSRDRFYVIVRHPADIRAEP